MLRPLVVAEVRVRRAGGEHEVIVGDPAVPGADAVLRGVDLLDLGQQHLDVVLPTEDAAERRGDVGGGQGGGGHLVQQGLEEVVVAAVDEQHVDVGAVQRLRGSQPGESPSDDDDPMSHVDRVRRCGRAGEGPAR